MMTRITVTIRYTNFWVITMEKLEINGELTAKQWVTKQLVPQLKIKVMSNS